MILHLARRPWFAVIVLVAALSHGTAFAEGRVPVDESTVRQKAVYVENLVTKSVSASRIEQEGDARARESLAKARALLSEAKADIARGAWEGANDKLDAALATVNRETRRLSGEEVRDAHDRDVYQRRLKSVRAILAAYERVAKESGSSSVAAEQEALIRERIARAEAAAAKEDYARAVAILDEAYKIARGDLRELRHGKTLTRSLDFATAAEAYEYELGRNRSHFLLLEYAIQENKPTGSVVGRIDDNRRKAEKLRAEAERLAAAGKHAEAIKSLEKSTNLLLQAIRMTGLFIPG